MRGEASDLGIQFVELGFVLRRLRSQVLPRFK